MTSFEMVERALDRYVAERRRRGMDPYGFHVKTLAHIARIPVANMSGYLQRYRMLQGRVVIRGWQPRYVIGAQNYGPNARWLILGKPGDDPKAVRRNRQDHMAYIVSDAAARQTRDAFHEVLPGLRRGKADKAIELAVESVREQSLSIVRLVAGILS